MATTSLRSLTLATARIRRARTAATDGRLMLIDRPEAARSFSGATQRGHARSADERHVGQVDGDVAGRLTQDSDQLLLEHRGAGLVERSAHVDLGACGGVLDHDLQLPVVVHAFSSSQVERARLPCWLKAETPR